MKELSNLSIKELIESIEENILETKGLRKRMLIELEQEKDVKRRMIKKEMVERYGENISRFKLQKFVLKEAMKEHAVYGYKKLDTKDNEKTEHQIEIKVPTIFIELDGNVISEMSKQLNDYIPNRY